MIQFLLLASNNLIFPAALIHPAMLAKLFLLTAIALLHGVLFYLALASPAGVRAFPSRSLTVLIVVSVLAGANGWFDLVAKGETGKRMVLAGSDHVVRVCLPGSAYSAVGR